jgi:DNA-binding response OmpR family regulator
MLPHYLAGEERKMKPSILIVDDEAVARQSLTDILRLEGYHVASVANGQAAVEYVRANHVELMVLDLRMPGMSGLEVVQVVNQVSPDTEIVMLTAYGSTESAVEALRLRVHDYLLKPATPAQIVASVAKGLSRRSAKMQAKGLALDGSDTQDGYTIVNLEDGTEVDLRRREIRSVDLLVQLTPAEGRLLKVLMENEGRVFSHRDLVLLVQGYETSQREAPEILRPLVSRLRHKLASVPSLKGRLVSVRGTGYVFGG